MNLESISNGAMFELERRFGRSGDGTSEEIGLRSAAQALVDRLDLIHKDERYKSVWVMASIHGQSYDGPNYEKELASLREALKK